MSGASSYVLRARTRGEWRALLALVVIAGVGFGGSLAAVALARRTASAHDRFFPSVHAYGYSTGFGAELAGEPMESALAEVPGLEHQQITGFVLDVEGVDISKVQFFFGWMDQVARLERPTIVTGRLPRDDAADEVVVNEEAARRTGLAVGDRLETGFLAFDLESGGLMELPDTQPLQVVGIVRLPDEFVLDDWRRAGIMMLSPAFVARHWDARVWGNAWMRLDRDAAIGPLQDALAGVGLAFDEDRTTERNRVWQSTRPLVIVIAVVGALAFLATWVLVLQALVRRRHTHDADNRTIRDLGGIRSDLRGTELIVALVAGPFTAMLATVVAVALSPLAPVGPYRAVDPGRGLFIDLAVAGAGAAVIVLTFVAVAVVGRGAPKGSAVGASPLPLPSLPITIRLGVRWAFDRRSGFRSLLGATAGIAASAALVVTAVVFIGSLRELGRRPAWQGQLWDAAVRTPYGELAPDAVNAWLREDLDVEGWTHALLVGGSIDGTPAPMIGLDPGLRGPKWPVVVDGEAPRAPDEILVGHDLLAETGLRIGDWVTLRGQDVEGGAAEPWEATVTGTAIFPNIGYRGVDPPRLGRGIAMEGDELRERTGVFSGTIALVDLAERIDTDHFAQTHAHIPAGSGSPSGADWVTDLEPVEVVQATHAAPTIWLTVAGLGLATSAMLAHVLATTVRRRRRDYGLLRALGLTGRQLISVVLAQAFAAYSAALVIAMVIGVALGRTVWRSFAGQLDVLPHPTVEAMPLVVVGLVGALSVALVVLPWARAARKVPPAQALRVE